MRSADPTLSVNLRHDIAPVNGEFEGHLLRDPQPSDSQKPGKHRLQGVRLRLGYVTEGRGDTDDGTVFGHEYEVDEWGRLSTSFRVPVPSDAPISYDGRLIRLRWYLTATVMIKMALDRPLEVPVLVIPANGWGLYDRPHPLASRLVGTEPPTLPPTSSTVRPPPPSEPPASGVPGRLGTRFEPPAPSPFEPWPLEPPPDSGQA